jgi:type VI secretion system protein ImpJ
LRPYDWGFLELELEQEGLALGRIGLRSCRAILPDGTPVHMPEELPAPPPLAVDGALRDQLVYLALPLRRVGQAEVSRNGEGTDTARYSAMEEEVRDGNLNGSGGAEIEVCREAVRLLPESADLGPYAAIGVCRVTQVQPDGTVQLDTAYIPPMLDCSASAGLAAIVSELNGKLRQTASALAERVSLSRQQASDLSSFLRLQLVNRYAGLFAHWDGSRRLHPETLYRSLLELAGELATFTRESRRPPDFPRYRHEDLQGSFGPVMAEVRRGLAVSFEENVLRLPLEERKFGVRVSPIADNTLLSHASFVLEVSADVPSERLRSVFPNRVKVGPVEEIRNLVNFRLSGIPITPLPAAPRQLPFHAGATYLELERGGEMWTKLATSGAFAFHVANPEELPGLEMVFWAIKGS